MPSFPGTVFSAANRSAGQTIASAHMNAVQDELNAITDGYINGTARLNSSGSTLASLDVNGNSTLASSITFGSIPYVLPSSGGSTGQVLTCVSTSGSTMGLEWRAIVASAPPVVKVTHNANQGLASTSFQGLDWNTEVYDSTGMHSTATNSSRITFVDSTGVYHIGVQVTFSTFTANAMNRVGIWVNDSSRAAEIGYLQEQNADIPQPYCVSADIRVASTADFITVRVRSNASTGAVLAESTGVPLGFWAHRVST